MRQEIRDARQAEALLQKEQRYLRHTLELQDRDRQLVAYEIHDGLVQQLAAAIMQLEMFGRGAGQPAAAAGDGFAGALEMLGRCMREARRDRRARARRSWMNSVSWPRFAIWLPRTAARENRKSNSCIIPLRRGWNRRWKTPFFASFKKASPTPWLQP